MYQYDDLCSSYLCSRAGYEMIFIGILLYRSPCEWADPLQAAYGEGVHCDQVDESVA